MGEIKQTNFRIDSNTADRFRNFCEENHLNQAQGFEHVMDVLAMNLAKESVPERKTEIEDFESHVKALMSAFLRSLEINANAENRVHESYKSQLDSKDKQIIQLQEEVRIQKEFANQMSDSFLEEERKRQLAEETMRTAQAQEQKAMSALTDKESLNALLDEKLKEAESKLKEYDTLIASRTELEQQLSAAQQTMIDMQKDAEMAKERAVAASKQEMQQAILEAEKAKNKEVQKLYEKIMMLQEESQASSKRASKKATPSTQTQ